MKKFFTFVGLLLLLGLRSSFADNPDDVTPTGFGVSIGSWISPNFSGIVKAGVGGTEISLNNNLGLTNQSILVPEVYYRWDHGQIFDVRYQQYSMVATTTLNVPETFQAVSFAPGTVTTTTGKFQWGELTYELPIEYDKFPPHNHFLNVFLEIEALRGTFMLNGQSGLGTNHSPITVPLPLVGVHGKYRFGSSNTSVEYKVSGIRAGFQDAIGWDYNYEVGINQSVFDTFSIIGKYRYSTFYNRDSNDNRFNFRLYGPEVDGMIRF